MKARCNNPKAPKYKYYGAKGVSICERWGQFENFLEDMGERPAGKSLDRFPDKKGNYCKDNCRWATIEQQNRNRNPLTRPRNAIGAAHRKQGSKPWIASIWVNGKSKYLGSYATEEEAHGVYERAKEELNG